MAPCDQRSRVVIEGMYDLSGTKRNKVGIDKGIPISAITVISPRCEHAHSTIAHIIDKRLSALGDDDKREADQESKIGDMKRKNRCQRRDSDQKT